MMDTASAHSQEHSLADSVEDVFVSFEVNGRRLKLLIAHQNNALNALQTCLSSLEFEKGNPGGGKIGSIVKEFSERMNHVISPSLRNLVWNNKFSPVFKPNRPLTDKDMIIAAKQATLALEIYVNAFPTTGVLEVNVDIGGGGLQAPNAIGYDGMKAISDALLQFNDRVHVKRLRCHASQLGDNGLFGVMPLIVDTTYPPLEVHLSHNNISTYGVSFLLHHLSQAIQARNIYPFNFQNGKSSPLWLRVEYNRINVDIMNKDIAGMHLLVCTEMNRDKCSPKKCSHSPTKSGAPIQIHLPYYQYQTVTLNDFVLKKKEKQRERQQVLQKKKRSIKDTTQAATLEQVAVAHELERSLAGLKITAPEVGHEQTKKNPNEENIVDENYSIETDTGGEEEEGEEEETIVLVDSNALIYLLSPQSSLTLTGLLATPTLFRGSFQLALCHTVGVELDGLKKGSLGGRIGPFLRDRGLKQQCLDAGLICEFSREEAEADIIASGQLQSTHLSHNDEMIVNVARHLRRTIMSLLNTSTNETAPANDVSSSSTASSTTVNRDNSDSLNLSHLSGSSYSGTESVLLLTGDANMTREAVKIGVPSVTVKEFEHAVFKRRDAFLERQQHLDKHGRSDLRNSNHPSLWKFLPHATSVAKETEDSIMKETYLEKTTAANSSLLDVISWLEWAEAAQGYLLPLKETPASPDGNEHSSTDLDGYIKEGAITSAVLPNTSQALTSLLLRAAALPSIVELKQQIRKLQSEKESTQKLLISSNDPRVSHSPFKESFNTSTISSSTPRKGKSNLIQNANRSFSSSPSNTTSASPHSRSKKSKSHKSRFVGEDGILNGNGEIVSFEKAVKKSVKKSVQPGHGLKTAGGKTKHKNKGKK
eukprot:m.84205 g.84205  ORF g.84205 m.84205 type:complete len:876 (-) comp8710_c0_seq4:4569-7196(-)